MTQPRFFDTPLPSPVTEFGCQVASLVNDVGAHYGSGSAVIIGPNLAFTARHVFDDHWQRHQGRAMREGRNQGHFSLTLFQLVGKKVNVWAAPHIRGTTDTDIVLLRLEPASEGARTYQFRRLTLDLMPPRVGDVIYAFGYHSNEVEERTPTDVTLWQRGATTSGEVIEVHHDERDKSACGSPVSARTRASMAA
jgi:hypothetical protein